MVTIYSVSVVIENLRNTEKRLLYIANLHTLVAENSRDVIILEDSQGNRTLVSSPDRFWSGWSHEDIQAMGSLERIHPDDRLRVSSAISDLRAGADGTLIEYRVGGRDGAFTWVEANLRTVRDPISRKPTRLLSNIRDISERKYAEQQLEDAFHAVEALAVTDALTGLANRRRFDQYLSDEWRRALRERTPLAMVLIDADLFKAYNDTYGHHQGDVCLQAIAGALRKAILRSSDLGSRIGGEEFAILLPNTYAEGARQLAYRVCEEVRNCAIEHSGSPHGIVTVSAGYSAMVPLPGQAASLLFDTADQAMYAAKHSGRNCVHPIDVPDAMNEDADADAFPSIKL